MEVFTPKSRSGQRPKKRKRVFVGSQSCSPVFRSASAKKVRPEHSTTSRKDTPVFKGYKIMDLSILNETLKTCVVCKVCQSETDIVEVDAKEIGSNFAIKCITCKDIASFSSCKKVGLKRNAMELNRRAVYAMRCLGQGLAGLRTFCGVMDLPPPMKQSSYENIVSNLHGAISSVAEESMQRAAEEEIAESYIPGQDISASFDGSWMKRGHTSLHGVVTCIGGITGKVIDAEVKSTHCKGCEQWKGRREGLEFEAWMKSHMEACCANYQGSSGKMELQSVIDIFQRSQQKRRVRYVEFIGDGDTQSYPGVLKAQPYGADVEIKKVECVGHIQKRMGTRLRKHKLSLSGNKLTDGKGIGGKGRLTDAAILKLTAYYGNAIRTHKDSAEEMRKAIWATFFHTRSSDTEPSHQFCPKDAKSWCGYNLAQACGEEAAFKHKSSLPVAVMDSIKPIFKDLSAPQLLRRCVGGRNQSNNESINNLIWKFCPKTTFSGRKVVEIATNEAILRFNDGMSSRIQVLKKIECNPGQHCIAEAAREDTMRIKMAERRAEGETLEARRARRVQKAVLVEKLVSKEGLTYGAGEF